MSTQRQDLTIETCRRVRLAAQIDGCNERIRTLESEKAQLQRELVAMEAQRDEARTERDTANGKVFQYTRRGW